MVTMSDWIFTLKQLGSKRTKTEIRSFIIEYCLISKEKIYGVYQVDSEKVWHYLVEMDSVCSKEAINKRLHNVIDVESWLDNIKYQQMRGTFPKNHHKKGR